MDNNFIFIYILITVIAFNCNSPSKSYTKVNELSSNCDSTYVFNSLEEAISNSNCVYQFSPIDTIYEFPFEVFKMGKIEYLDFTGQPIVELPKNIGNLNTLKSINFSHCNISSIPESIGSLKKLNYMAFINNKIDSLPACLCRLEGMLLLNFKGNPIKYVAPCIKEKSFENLPILYDN